MKASFLSVAQRYRAERGGVALLMTLSIVVLVTVLILAFLALATLNRRLSQSDASLLKSQFMARSALDLIVGELRSEIADPNNSVIAPASPELPATVTQSPSYTPKSPANALPQKIGVSSPDTIGASTILKVSAANQGVRANGPANIQGTTASISSPSFNGRYVSSTAWFGTSGPQLGTQTTMPTWLVVSRNNSVIQGSQAATLLSQLGDSTSDNFVIGRFAYTVYDLSGQIDANVAGYPTKIIAATTAGYKSSLAYSDLTQVSGMSSTTVASLSNWRNGTNSLGSGYTAAIFDQWATGLAPSSSYATTNAALTVARGGHLSILAGDNAFLSRHDLIRAANNSMAGLSTTTLGYLTHFSRTQNAPSWSPTADGENTTDSPLTGTTYNYAYKSNQDVDTVTGATSPQANRNLPNVRFANGGAVTHYDDSGVSALTTTYAVAQGDQLLQRRFSLAKIAWLQHKEENPTDTSLDTAIQYCFGLSWDNTNERWDYIGSTGTVGAPLSQIETLHQIASETSPREANFFELVKAGILSGSLGLTAPYATSANSANTHFTLNQNVNSYDPVRTIESNKDLQILKIGANIIDSAETDNYPTVIDLKFGTVAFEVAGDVDLPHLWSFEYGLAYQTAQEGGADTTVPKVINYGQSNATGRYLTSADLITTPIFFNGNRTPTVAVASSKQPANVRFIFTSGAFITAYFGSKDPYRPPKPDGSDDTAVYFYVQEVNKDLTDTTKFPPIVIPSSSYETFRKAPQAMTSATATSNTFSKLVGSWVDSAIQNVIGYNFFSYEKEYSSSAGAQWTLDEPTAVSAGNPSAYGVMSSWAVTSVPYNNDVGTSSGSVYTPGSGLQAPYFSAGYSLQNAFMAMQYQTRQGNWKNYEEFGGYSAFKSSGGGMVGIGAGSYDPTTSIGGFEQAYAAELVDPRTQRLGPSQAIIRPIVTSWLPLEKCSVNSLYSYNAQPQDLIAGSQAYGPWYPPQVNICLTGRWPQGGRSQYLSVSNTQLNSAALSTGSPTTQIANGVDPDNTPVDPSNNWISSSSNLRVADSFLGPDANPLSSESNGSPNNNQSALDTTTQARPLLLHRPYRSVAELGYVFRDEPYKTLSFFDQSSADGALLDLFAVSDQPTVVAGYTNLNSQQVSVLTAILSGTGQNFDGSNVLSTYSNVAKALNTYSFTSGTPTTSMAFNPAQIPAFVTSLGPKASALLDDIKYHREAVPRALNQATQTRTWNLLIDVVAQVGRYKASPSSLNDFIVEGQTRYWLSVAIDRYTNKIIDEQLEPVNE